MKQDGATRALRSMSETHDHPMVELSKKHVASQFANGEHDIHVGNISSHATGERLQLETKRYCHPLNKSYTSHVALNELEKFMTSLIYTNLLLCWGIETVRMQSKEGR